MKRYCDDMFPCFPVVRDSVRVITNIQYRDTLIYVPIPGDTVYDTVIMDSSERAYSRLDVSFATSEALFEGGILTHRLMQHDSLLQLKIANAIKEAETIKDKEVERIVEVNKLSGWQWFQLYGFWVVSGLYALTLLIKKIPTAIVKKALTALKKKK